MYRRCRGGYEERLKDIFNCLYHIVVDCGAGLVAVSPYLSAVGKYIGNAKAIAAESRLSDFRSTETSIIYDVNGEEITTVSGVKELYYLESYKIPKVVKEHSFSLRIESSTDMEV